MLCKLDEGGVILLMGEDRGLVGTWTGWLGVLISVKGLRVH